MVDRQGTRKIAVVTGGMGGIGCGTTVAMTKRGLHVVVCDRIIDATAAEQLKAQLAPDAEVAFAAGDLADLDDHPRFIDEIFNGFGRVDCLINNAGVSVKSRGDLLDVSIESYDLNFDVNTRGTFSLTQAICKSRRRYRKRANRSRSPRLNQTHA
jgi:3-oxoacyl-[acyl-carrier protein] reductase